MDPAPAGHDQAMSEPAVRLRAEVHGHVQGVGFRYRARQRARRLGLEASAENRGDGSVLVVAEGGRRACEELVDYLRGPDTPGRVEHVAVGWEQVG
jgi:acylphosphatase